MIFPRGARLITPAENQRFSLGTPSFAPREKSEIFPAGTPYATAEKYCRRGTFSGGCAHTRARVIFNEIIPLPHRKSRGGIAFLFVEELFSPPHIFYYKSAPSVAGAAATLGAILYKSLGSRGIMPLAGSRGRAPWCNTLCSVPPVIFKHFLTKLPTHSYFDLHFCKVF